MSRLIYLENICPFQIIVQYRHKRVQNDLAVGKKKTLLYKLEFAMLNFCKYSLKGGFLVPRNAKSASAYLLLKVT